MGELYEKNHHDCHLGKEECHRIFDLMIRSLDGELSFDQEHQLMHDMQSYPCCVQKFELEKSYKEFLCNKITRKQVSDSLINTIKEKVREIGFRPTIQ